jgi:protein SCO1
MKVPDRPGHRPGGAPWRIVARVLVLVALGCGGCVAGAGCGSSDSADPAPSSGGSELSGLILRPAKPAPPLALRNYTGRPVSIATLRGKAVLVTFVYTHCPDVCPLIISDLAAAQRGLGKEARSVRIVAVTVDPRRDTAADVRAFLAARGATGRMDYLLGTVKELKPIWKAWGVGVSTGHNKFTDGHSDIVYGITASGDMAVVYPSNFTPKQIIHDVPLLARS